MRTIGFSRPAPSKSSDIYWHPVDTRAGPYCKAKSIAESWSEIIIGTDFGRQIRLPSKTPPLTIIWRNRAKSRAVETSPLPPDSHLFLTVGSRIDSLQSPGPVEAAQRSKPEKEAAPSHESGPRAFTLSPIDRRGSQQATGSGGVPPPDAGAKDCTHRSGMIVADCR